MLAGGVDGALDGPLGIRARDHSATQGSEHGGIPLIAPRFGSIATLPRYGDTRSLASYLASAAFSAAENARDLRWRRPSRAVQRALLAVGHVTSVLYTRRFRRSVENAARTRAQLPLIATTQPPLQLIDS